LCRFLKIYLVEHEAVAGRPTGWMYLCHKSAVLGDIEKGKFCPFKCIVVFEKNENNEG
jgi:hypothetical protein